MAHKTVNALKRQKLKQTPLRVGHNYVKGREQENHHNRNSPMD